MTDPLATVLRTVETEHAIAVPEFPVMLDALAQLVNHFPSIALRFVVDLAYPYPLLPTCDPEQRRLIYSLYQRFSLNRASDVLAIAASAEGTPDADAAAAADTDAELVPWTNYRFLRVERGADGATMHALFALNSDGAAEDAVSVPVYAGPRPSVAAEFFVETPYHGRLLQAMLQTHAVTDFCLIGAKGVGKSALVRQFARSLGYLVEYIPLYRDMTPRDLLQRRSTLLNGDTIWEVWPSEGARGE